MLQYNIQKDWKAAFETVITQRKFRTEARNAKDRGHKRAWEERDSSHAASSPVLEAVDGDENVNVKGEENGGKMEVDEEDIQDNA